MHGPGRCPFIGARAAAALGTHAQDGSAAEAIWPLRPTGPGGPGTRPERIGSGLWARPNPKG
jgi:hypothetical protein